MSRRWQLPSVVKNPRAKHKAQPAQADSGITRLAIVWLLLAVLLVVLPHVARMPVWLTVVCSLCLVTRILIYQGRSSVPSKKFKVAAVALIIVLIVVQYGRQIFSIDATVSVLLSGITLKLLEMQQRRDALLVIYLCYFTVIAEFIYSQAIPIALYMALVVAVITSAWLSLHQTPAQQRPWRTFKLSALILVQSLPLMAVLFLLLPRISPLWAMPVPSNKGTTGLSDFMEPGAIGELARSAEVAFRVKFKDDTLANPALNGVPAYSELYWRAVTLDEFNGKRWQRSSVVESQYLGANPREVFPWYRGIDYRGQSYDYNIILEATNQNWLYTLQMPRVQQEGMLMRSDYQLSSLRPISQRFSYDLRSYLDYRADAGDEGRMQRLARVLPKTGNERARTFATTLRAQVASDRDYIDAVLANFRNEAFFYTLSPPVLGANPVDEFLFDTRQGFCEHYASSFTYLMRAAGLPARVVTGYMGGEFNPYDGTLVVRQYDAHAWSEVWLPGEGWVRFDPTAAVAPQRVSQGSSTTLQTQAGFMQNEMFTLMRFRNSLLLNKLRYRLEMVDYAWNRFVLNYNPEMQFQLFNKLFGALSQTKMALAVLGIIAILLALMMFVVFRQASRKSLPATTRYFLAFCDYLAGQGFSRQPGETASAFLSRVSSHQPRWQPALEIIANDYSTLVYVESQPSKASITDFKRKLRQFRLLK